MIQSFIHKSDKSNVYLFDDQHRLSMLVHPEFEKIYEKSIDVDSYYLKKYVYLSDNGFFTEPKLVDFRILHESMVRENIINTKQVVFEVTESCNLKCTYCALGDLYECCDERTGKNINTHYAINLLKYIFDLKPKDKNSKLFISFYGGEPLLNIKFIKQIVEVTNQLNVEKKFELQYSMTTNATLIHKCHDFLAANKFSLLISLDGGEENNSYRVFSKNKKNTFHKVTENLDMLQRNYPEYFAEHVNFNAVLHNRNSVKEIYEFIYSRYKKIPRISELNMRDIRPDNKDVIESMFHSKWNSEAEYQKENTDLPRITHRVLSLFEDLTVFLKYCSINY